MTRATRSVVIHGHFYQPPREDPWLEEVEREPGAAPFHDWNERIERECYRAVVAARTHAPDGRIARIVNLLEGISFDCGPTLLEWLEREALGTYASILYADRSSQERLGHGNAMAMPYHHVILPLSSRREKVSEVRWGIADFRRRFGRDPVGMWLPETAVDDETLDVLAAEEIRFTVLAPHQVAIPPARGLPGRYRTAGGREIALFVYDGPISHDVAFGPLLKNTRLWLERLDPAERRDESPEVVAIATDGETFGHHHRFGEMALAWVLSELERRGDVRVENFSTVLARHPPIQEVTIIGPSSWSCPHGVERWRADCGCRMAPERPSQQRWRVQLRGALDWLAGELHAQFERDGAEVFADPWAARDAYGGVVGADGDAILRFVSERVRRGGTLAARVRAAELLELERNAMRMFTSCGWFFDDIAGIEGIQVLRYAARATELAGADAGRLEAGLLERLAPVESNDPRAGSGREIYLDRVKPRIHPLVRLAGGSAAAKRLAPDDASAESRCYSVLEAMDRVRLTHCRTGREYEYCVSVERVGGSRIAVEVAAPADGRVTRLGLTDLPERQQHAVAGVLRRELIERRLSSEEMKAVATGAAELLRVAEASLVRAVSRLEHDASARAVGTVSDLADLLELLGLPIPFDAQTTLYRIRAAAAPDVAARLAPLAWRLGFAAVEGD